LNNIVTLNYMLEVTVKVIGSATMRQTAN